MWEVISACVIIHNMIIESERANPEAEFAAFITTHQKFRDEHVHTQLNNDNGAFVDEERKLHLMCLALLSCLILFVSTIIINYLI
jgi:hypothetical protein